MVLALQGGSRDPRGLLFNFPSCQSTFTIIYLFVHPSIFVTLSLSSFLFLPCSLSLSQSLSPLAPLFLFLLLSLTPPHCSTLFSVSPFPVPSICVCLPTFLSLLLSPTFSICLSISVLSSPPLSFSLSPLPPSSPGLSSQEPSPLLERGAVPLTRLLPSSPRS